jgi:hypothetical protein
MTAHQIREWTATGGVACVLAACGCGSAEQTATDASSTGTATHAVTTAPASTAPATPTAAVPAALRGHWKRTMKDADWGSAGSGFPVGTWRLAVDAHGDVDVYQPGIGDVDFTTKFIADGHRLTIATLPVCPDKTGRYTWRASSGAMTLTVAADDGCPPRAALFGGTWTRGG